MAGSKGLSQRRKEDRISQLPDSLICDILSHLPIKEAVSTSVLSNRWKSLWLWVPSLELSSLKFRKFNTFNSFGDRFFDSNRASSIHKLILRIYGNNEFYLKSWIDASVKRKIQHLDLQSSVYEYLYEMPISLFTCETLVFLKLKWVALPDAEFVSLPCLKTMHLVRILYPDDATLERLVSSCPVLDDLEIDDCWNADAIVFRVLSRSLKKLTIELVDSFSSGVVIDAPQLDFLRIRDRVSDMFVVTSIGSNARLDLSLTFGSRDINEASVLWRRSSIRGLILGVSTVMDMTISRETFQLLCEYSKLEPLPRFGDMSRLHISLRVTDLKWLTTFLESFPNLKSLVLVCDDDYEKMNETSFSTVPECLPLSLEFVDFEIPISGHVGEMKLVRYFLENSAVLKKLTLTLEEHST